jgi:integrase
MPIQRRKDSGAWEVVVPRSGKTPLRKSSAKWTYADAQAAEQQLLDPVYTLEQGLDKWLAEYANGLRGAKTYRSSALHLRPLLSGRSFEDIPLVVSECKKAWSELKIATINRRLAVLRRVANLAFTEWGWIKTPEGKKIKLAREHNERHYYLTRAEIERLRMNCTVHEAGQLIVFASFTGMRLTEMLTVKAEDLRGDDLHIPKTKNGRPRVIPLHPRAAEIARQLPYPNITQAILRKQWVSTREKSGLAHIHWHDLRHTFASWLVQANTPIQVVKELMGHENISMTMRYAHLSVDNLRTAVTSL